jgi:hypothetical protein
MLTLKNLEIWRVASILELAVMLKKQTRLNLTEH